MTNIVPIGVELSPAAIGRMAERRLHTSNYYFLKSLTCQFNAGVLTVLGSVPNERLSKIAESIVAQLPGVRNVVNRVEVVDPMRRPLGGQEMRNAG